MHASLKLSLSAIIALALASPAVAQDSRKPTSGASSTGSTAAPRGGSSSAGSSGSSSSSGGSTASGGETRGGTAVSRPAPSREPQSEARRRSSSAESSGGGPAIPAYSRPRGDRAVRGTAVDRETPRPGNGRDIVYVPYYGYNNYYGYNSFYGSRYPFGYPLYTGIGYFYYDPYWGYYDPYYGRGYGSGGYGRASKDDRDYDIGSLRLKVDPSHAQVFVDGLYRGIVDDFDGILQRLKLEAGAHRLEVRAPGFETLVFDVLVTPGETTTYRGDLKRQ